MGRAFWRRELLENLLKKVQEADKIYRLKGIYGKKKVRKMDIKVSIENTNLTIEELAEKKKAANNALDKLWSGNVEYTGWVQAPLKQDKEDLDYLLNVADIVKTEAELMVVIGVGGSYMGAKAAIEALPKYEDGIEVLFAGINFNSPYHKKIMDEMSRKETVLCVVSKSGNTMEVRAAFEIMKALMEEKYGSKEAAARRIITITDKTSGALREETEKEGYVSFEIPEDVGGRYSVMTPAGLFPMAVAGIDIRAFIEGERAAATSPDWDKDATDYAIARHLMIEKGKHLETIELYDARLEYLGEWMKQLYGESEGKEGKGLFPVVFSFSTDLHSIGQFLQQGNQVFFETVVIVDQYDEELLIPAGPLAGRTLEELNRITVDSVIAAHKQADIPIIEIRIPKLDAYHYGQLIYFLQTTCAITGMLMGINPFDQPGVEDYKSEIRKRLGQ